MNGPSLQPLPGDPEASFGRYRIIKKLASGGMGEIYLASLEREEGFSKRLVIKKLLPSLSRNPSFVSMFNNEARLAAQLSHANVVHIFDFGRMDDSHFIAMEWVHGENLSDVIAQCKDKTSSGLPARAACEIAIQLLRGLDYAHRKTGQDGAPLGLVHRDIAPKNVLLSYEGEVKIIDFGLAKAAAAGDATESGALKGSYSYMSPEQVAGKHLDARSDLFSAALVLYEMLTGERLYPPEMGLRPLLEAIQHGDLSWWKSQGKDPWAALPPGLARVLQKALSKEPAQRYATAAEFVKALEEFLSGEGRRLAETPLPALLRDLFGAKMAAEGALGGAEKRVERTRVSAAAQQALQGESRTEGEGPVAVPTTGSAGFLFNLLAFVILISILSGGGYLGWRYLVRPALYARKFAIVRIVSDPPGATVLLDGQAQKQPTPAKLKYVPVGVEHILRLEKPGYKAEEKRLVFQKGGEQPQIEKFTLAKAFGQVFLVTDPPGAAALLDGKSVPGKTPMLIENVEVAAEHQLELALADYRPEPITFEVPPDQVIQRLVVEMVPLKAGLRVQSTPPGADVFIQGKRAGRTPYATENVRIGEELSIRVHKPGWRAHVHKARIQEGANVLRLTLEQLQLEARLRWKGEVRFELDGKPLSGETLRLPVGEHLLRALAGSSGEEIKFRLQVRENKKREGGVLLWANVDAKPWGKVKTGPPEKEAPELATPVSGLAFGRGPGRLLAGLPGGTRIEISFEIP